MDHLNRATIGVSLDLNSPARVKALPMKLFEYMAAGLPIVATDLPNTRRILAQAECGLLAPPEDPDALAGLLCRLLDDPQEAQQLGRQGLEAFKRQFSWESQDSDLQALYRKAWPETPPSRRNGGSP